MTLVWRPGFQFDDDASTYIEAVEAADTQALETGVRYAINDFVIGCKNDGIWDAIKASCILAGARTLAGALVPLVGTAPTNYNFVSGDYDRETGLAGDGSTKYLDSNRAGNAQSGSNLHLSTYATTSLSNNGNTIGITATGTPTSTSGVFALSSSSYIYANSPTGAASNASQLAITGAGFYGCSRSDGTTFSARHAGTPQTKTVSTGTLPAVSFNVFADNLVGTGARLYTNARLDTRVSALITAIGAAIP
jgi:hypothetical protein